MAKQLLVIFGASGDLFTHKLAPALARVYRAGRLSDCDIWGASRKTWTDEEFRERVNASVEERDGVVPEEFLARIAFKNVDIHEKDTLDAFMRTLVDAQKAGDYDKVLIYVSTAPQLFTAVFTSIGALQQPCPWLSVVVEKPYGTSVEHAQQLDALVKGVLAPSAIYRIDHYLTKETMQDILAFRFANELFATLWHRDHVERIEVVLHESGTIRDRAAFYDAVGALADVGQNHMLQMLAAVTMTEPQSFEASAFHVKRSEVLNALEVLPELGAIRGQYEGYRATQGVDPASQTETFFAICAHINTDRWQGVPIYFEAGKGLAKKQSYIRIVFKQRAFRITRGIQKTATPNCITFQLFPKEKIEITMLGKLAGFNSELVPRTSSFSIQDSPDYTGADSAYDHVFVEALAGDQVLFASSHEAQAGWRFVEAARKVLAESDLITYSLGGNPGALRDILME